MFSLYQGIGLHFWAPSHSSKKENCMGFSFKGLTARGKTSR
jgi:hypothetical protein